MKKIIIVMFFFLLLSNVYANNDIEIVKNAKNVVLMEESTGNILYEKNKDEKVAVASMTKMVAQIIILENIESGNLKWDEVITVSSNASGMGGSQIYLKTGEKMTVRDLMKGITMASANEVVVAISKS